MWNNWDDESEDTIPVEMRQISTNSSELGPTFYLTMLMGTSAGKRFVLEKDVIIGRDPEATIQLAAGDISRHHAQIYRTEAGDYLLEDLQSQNGTLVNGVRVGRHLLKVGDKIQFGASSLFLFTHYSPLEDQLNQEQKLESIGRLAGGVAHDFNNLMAIVLANIDFLRQTLMQEIGERDELIESMNSIELAAKRASDLTRQLLGFARRGKYENRPMDISLIFEEAVGFIRRSFDPSIIILVNIQPNLIVTGDSVQLHQVLMNLCVNARDAMPIGGTLTIKGSLTTVREEQALKIPSLLPGPYVLLTVQDTGLGMDKDTCKKIFEPFFTTKELGKGSGLGLATVYGIIKNHGGHIEVDSAVGQGTTFSVYLPTADMVSRELSAKPTLSIAPAIGSTILFVEDVETERKTTTKLLERLGYQVIEAQDGREAVKLFMKHRQEIKLVLLDMILPNLSGTETFRWLRKIDPQIKVLITSGYIDEERASDLLAQGALGFLPKPHRTELLQSAVLVALCSGQNNSSTLR